VQKSDNVFVVQGELTRMVCDHGNLEVWVRIDGQLRPVKFPIPGVTVTLVDGKLLLVLGPVGTYNTLPDRLGQ